jgi:hypothetical protein
MNTLIKNSRKDGTVQNITKVLHCTRYVLVQQAHTTVIEASPSSERGEPEWCTYYQLTLFLASKFRLSFYVMTFKGFLLNGNNPPKRLVELIALVTDDFPSIVVAIHVNVLSFSIDCLVCVFRSFEKT